MEVPELLANAFVLLTLFDRLSFYDFATAKRAVSTFIIFRAAIKESPCFTTFCFPHIMDIIIYPFAGF